MGRSVRLAVGDKLEDVGSKSWGWESSRAGGKGKLVDLGFKAVFFAVGA